jgi:hypothetical protein
MTTASPEQRLELTRLILSVLDDWNVRAADQIALLGLPEDTKPRAMKRYGDSEALPDEPQINERIEHLAGIADALRTSYPRNPAMGRFWINRACDWFDGQTPLKAMLEGGLDGVIAVRCHLDCAFDWDMSGSSNTSIQHPSSIRR